MLSKLSIYLINISSIIPIVFLYSVLKFTVKENILLFISLSIIALLLLLSFLIIIKLFPKKLEKIPVSPSELTNIDTLLFNPSPYILILIISLILNTKLFLLFLILYLIITPKNKILLNPLFLFLGYNLYIIKINNTNYILLSNKNIENPSQINTVFILTHSFLLDDSN